MVKVYITMDFMAIEIVIFPMKHGDFSSSVFVNVYQRVTRMGKPWLICQMISKKLIDHDLSTCSLIINHAQINLRMGNMLMLLDSHQWSWFINMLEYAGLMNTSLCPNHINHIRFHRLSAWMDWTVSTLSHAEKLKVGFIMDFIMDLSVIHG